jgi:hypothetical protein
MIGKKKAVVEEMLCGKWIPPIMKSPIPDLDVCKLRELDCCFQGLFSYDNLLRRCFGILTLIYPFLKKRKEENRMP